MKTLLLFIVMAALASVALADVDVTGKWSGGFNATGPNGEAKVETALLELKQNGTEITGTVGPDEDKRLPIQKGKIEGDKITLEADNEGHLMKFDLVFADGRITGEAQISKDGETRKARLNLSRAK
jgi:hypothetical protein